MRFSAARRLRTASEFGRVRAEGAAFPGKYMVLGVLRTPDGLPWKCGIITSRKAGGAVQRNLIRRRTREILRALTLPSGLWLVVIARWRAKEASFAELQGDIVRTARRAGLLLRTSEEDAPS